MAQMIGQTIRELRKKQSVTQAELASAVGVSMQAVSKWECGGTPDVEMLPVIAAFFDVSVNRLFGLQTVQDAGLDVVIQQELTNLPESKRMQRAADLVWAALKGLVALPNIVDLDYTAPLVSSADDCSRFRLNFDSGMAYGSAEAGAISMFMLPEPEGGYRSLLKEPAHYVDLFAALADPLLLTIIYFFYSRRPIPCSVPHIASELKREEAEITDRLTRMQAFGFVLTEEVQLRTGPVTLYRPVLSEAFVALIYFAGEVLRRQRLWYFSNSKRDKPIL